MRESDIETYLRQRMQEIGGASYKFTSPQRRSVPDRICIFPGTYGARVAFVELKAPGKKPTAAQEREHQRLRALGCIVVVIDSKDGVDNLIGYPR